MRQEKIRVRKKRTDPFEKISLPDREKIDYLAKTLTKQIDREVFEKKSAPVKEVLKLVGAGAFLAASFAIPNLPLALKPFLTDSSKQESWKRFNIPYLKRVLYRLEKQKLVEVEEENGLQIIKITDRGRRRILKYSLDELAVEKPKKWDGFWRMVSYDLPEKFGHMRNILREYLRAWGFYPLQESVYLHAYPCLRQVEFLREYMGVGKYVRSFIVSEIENDKEFREFFGV